MQQSNKSSFCINSDSFKKSSRKIDEAHPNQHDGKMNKQKVPSLIITQQLEIPPRMIIMLIIFTTCGDEKNDL